MGLARVEQFGSGAYAVNHDIGVFIKHTTHDDSPFQFTFSADHQQAIRDVFRHYDNQTFLVLVCGEVGICALTCGEYASVIDENFKEQRGLQWSALAAVGSEFVEPRANCALLRL